MTRRKANEGFKLHQASCRCGGHGYLVRIESIPGDPQRRFVFKPFKCPHGVEIPETKQNAP